VPDRDIHNNGEVECPTDRRADTIINLNMGTLLKDFTTVETSD
jgi:hypothetical protein